MEPENDRASTKLHRENDATDGGDESEMLKASRNELEKFIHSAFREAKENDRMDELWEKMPVSWKNDPVIVLGVSKIGCIAALKAPCLLFSNWQEVPTRWRNEMDFAKHFLLSRPYYDKDYPYGAKKTSQVFLEHPSLRSDIDFWMRAVSLDCCSDKIIWLWRAFVADSVGFNKPTMLKACLLNGKFDWDLAQYVGASLWLDRDFGETVLTSNPRALLHLSPESQRLFPDLVLRAIEKYWQHPKTIMSRSTEGWDLARKISPDLWNDRQVVLMWFRSGFLYVEEVFPDAWKDDREIFLQIASHGHDDRYNEHAQNFKSYASPALRGDRDFMLLVCRHDCYYFNGASAALKRDEIFVQEALRQDPGVLEYLPHETQCLFPDLVRQAFRPLGQHPEFKFLDWNELANNMAPDIWTDRNAVIAWFEAGLPFLADVFPDAWTFDREIFLLLARHCRREYLEESFSAAAESIRSDKDFMIAAVVEYAILFFCASEELQLDFDLIVLVCSSSEEAAGHFAREARCDGYLELVAQVHDAYMHSIVFGMDKAANLSCALCVLDQGPDMWLAHTVAEFLGIPVGKEQRLLRLASENLLQGYEP
jgi:Domain of unknown function (DUF4116)